MVLDMYLWNELVANGRRRTQFVLDCFCKLGEADQCLISTCLKFEPR